MKKSKSSPLGKALRLLSYRPRSVKEIATRVDASTAKQLTDINLLNDQEFADWYVASRLRSRPMSKRLLTVELKRKGIAPETISASLTGVNDHQSAVVALDKKKTLKSYKQACSFLSSRGFSWEVIEKATKNRYN